MIAEVQCLPQPMGTPGDPYCHVDAAIAVIQASGLRYEVGALGTTIEGDPGAVWTVARAVHEACLTSGATGVVTVVKFAQSGVPGDDVAMVALTRRFRP